MLLFKKYRSVVSNKNLLCCVFIKLVCMFVVSINTVFGDVVKSNLTNNINNDKPTHNLNGTQNITKNSFANIVQTHRNNNNGQLIDFPEENLFVGNMWQMPGCCAFFNGEDVFQQLYYAKKRIYIDGAYIPNNADDPLSYSNYMHTERQLAIVSMYDKLAGDNGLQVANNLQEFINGSLIVPNGLQQQIIDGNVQATIHTYTHANPCQNTVQDNCYMSCVDYFNRLANAYPNINFCVYFYSNDMQLNKDFFINNSRSAIALCNFIKNNRDNLHGLRFNDNWIEVEGGQGWKKAIRLSIRRQLETWNVNVTRDKIGNIVDCVKKVNLTLRNGNNLANEQKESLFNSVHNPNNIPNIHYYPI